MADETAEVRSLLMRHRLSIVRDLIGTALVQVLLKSGVLTADQEQQLSAEPSLDVRCELLIELIARDGFEKFKHFCYAIESECSQLISDLINDKLSQVDGNDDDDGGDGDGEGVGETDGYDAANITVVASAAVPAIAASATYEEQNSLCCGFRMRTDEGGTVRAGEGSRTNAHQPMPSINCAVYVVCVGGCLRLSSISRHRPALGTGPSSVTLSCPEAPRVRLAEEWKEIRRN
ncbi:hypothetical protein ZHAS_00021238 [Anopheles sinensis]|uniref:CARD domain-containing protein n=1 Tax=Anopheles sinensis TaxID=74873 RepID=A0A084WRU3_ANOSI|nr:hypothetical protein ZHAS_00021238 [Anopheles sinensis]